MALAKEGAVPFDNWVAAWRRHTEAVDKSGVESTVAAHTGNSRVVENAAAMDSSEVGNSEAEIAVPAAGLPARHAQPADLRLPVRTRNGSSTAARPVWRDRIQGFHSDARLTTHTK